MQYSFQEQCTPIPIDTPADVTELSFPVTGPQQIRVKPGDLLPAHEGERIYSLYMYMRLVKQHVSTDYDPREIAARSQHLLRIRKLPLKIGILLLKIGILIRNLLVCFCSHFFLQSISYYKETLIICTNYKLG